MIKKIARLLRGGKPTLLDTDKANELIDAINSLQNISIMEGEETRASITNTGINLTIKNNKPKPFPNIKIKAEPPLMVKQLDKYSFQFWIEGYTRNIKYCGGEGRLLHLSENYNSTDINQEDFADDTINTTNVVNGTDPAS